MMLFLVFFNKCHTISGHQVPGKATQSAGSMDPDEPRSNPEWIQRQLGATQHKVNQLQQTQEHIFGKSLTNYVGL